MIGRQIVHASEAEQPDLAGDCGACIKPHGPLEQAKRAHDKQIDLEALDTTLEFIVKFLEGDHAKSQQLGEIDRARILQHVKEALAWKKCARTQRI